MIFFAPCRLAVVAVAARTELLRTITSATILTEILRGT